MKKQHLNVLLFVLSLRKCLCFLQEQRWKNKILLFFKKDTKRIVCYIQKIKSVVKYRKIKLERKNTAEKGFYVEKA